MSELNVERKLELTKQIRSQNAKDRFDLSRREQIIYGKTTENTIANSFTYDENEAEEDTLPTLPLRFLLAVGLFLMIIMCDVSGESFLGISAKQCFEAIGQDYESSITAWVDAASENIVSK